jgi:hypothetical protein
MNGKKVKNRLCAKMPRQPRDFIQSSHGAASKVRNL